MPSTTTSKSTKSSSPVSGLKRSLFIVKQSRIQGQGAFATGAIAAEVCLTEYSGVRVSDEEAGRRYDDETMNRHHTFLFSIGPNISIDGRDGGNDSRFINHSCEPNCEAQQDGDRVYIYTLRAIKAGEELFYDYAYELPGVLDAKTRAHYKCLCGTPSCRGTILNLSAKQKKAALAAKKKPSRPALNA